MQLTDKLATPGEHPYFFPGQVGQLEVIVTVPTDANRDYVAILGHPNSLQGGSMSNKVVTTMVRVFKELGIPSIRFNFRGVGQSAGEYDAGIGESDDMELIAHQWLSEIPQAQLIFAGFSFGSYVTYRVASRMKHALLISIAPAVHLYDYTEFLPEPTPWIVVQGDEDEVVPASMVVDCFAKTNALPILMFEKTSHFFHGQLILLKQRLTDAISKVLM